MSLTVVNQHLIHEEVWCYISFINRMFVTMEEMAPIKLWFGTFGESNCN